MMKVAFHTLGCKVNQYETEAMEEMFLYHNYEVVDEEEVADVYVINTCTVTNMSDRKSRQFIRRSKKLNENSVIAVVGCYSQVSPEEVEKIEGVDVIIGTSDRIRVVELCEEAKEKNEKINIVRDIKKQKTFETINIEEIKEKTRAYMKIQDGCNQYCSYCIIPYARGPIRSRERDDILEEANRLSKAGFKEIILTGIHVASYGKDLGKLRLIDIIEDIAKIDGIERIRLSSVEPNLVDEDFMSRIVATGKVCDHFHLSLQSGSDTVLERMNRKYSSSEYYEKVELIRKHMPNAGLTTDIIVGFPGETDEEFNETMEFVKKVEFSRIHVFKYSKRDGTPAAESKDQVHGEIKNERSEKLIELASNLMENFGRKFIGKRLSVLIEEESKDNATYMEGYSTNYIRVKIEKNDDLYGKIEDVLIDKVEGEDLIGTI